MQIMLENFTTFEIISVIFDLIIIFIVTIQFFKKFSGNCRGMLVSKTQDGEFIKTREAKLSMHEMQPLQPLQPLQPINTN